MSSLARCEWMRQILWCHHLPGVKRWGRCYDVIITQVWMDETDTVMLSLPKCDRWGGYCGVIITPVWRGEVDTVSLRPFLSVLFGIKALVKTFLMQGWTGKGDGAGTDRAASTFRAEDFRTPLPFYIGSSKSPSAQIRCRQACITVLTQIIVRPMWNLDTVSYL